MRSSSSYYRVALRHYHKNSPPAAKRREAVKCRRSARRYAEGEPGLPGAAMAGKMNFVGPTPHLSKALSKSCRFNDGAAPPACGPAAQPATR